MDLPWFPAICLFTHLSLRAFFTQTLGIFFPSTMLNTVFTSVWGWNWGVHKGWRITSDEMNKWCLSYIFWSFLCSLHSISSLRLQIGLSTWRFLVVICQKKKRNLTVVFALYSQLEKSHKDYKKCMKCKKKENMTWLFIRRSNTCAMLYLLVDFCTWVRSAKDRDSSSRRMELQLKHGEPLEALRQWSLLYAESFQD